MIESVGKNLEVQVRGLNKPVLNLSSFDFLGLSTYPSVKEVSKNALDKYGCGSCGPRGFYGTIDQHLLIEAALADFMGTEEAILYSDGASAVSSAIPAFSKKGDLLIVDEACSEPILTGVNLSRSTVQYFKHNDMEDLAAILQSIANEDKRLNVDTTQQRRFIVVEGVYRNTGELVNLPQLLLLKKKYFYRVIVDESLSFGTIGATGRGITEYFDVKITDLEIVIVALDTVLASIGGACIGTREIVDHQRLSGAGYCFSASAPPFLSAAAVETLNIMKTNPKLIQTLNINSKLLYNSLKTLETKGLKIIGSSDLGTPVIHLLFDPEPLTKDIDNNMIIEFAAECLKNGVGVSTSKFSILRKTNLRPSVRVCASALLTQTKINSVIKGINSALTVIQKKYKNQI